MGVLIMIIKLLSPRLNSVLTCILFIDECCPLKVVGGIDYKHVGEIYNPNDYGCSNGCLYERVYGNQNIQYCFKPGPLISECGSYTTPVSHGKHLQKLTGNFYLKSF